jgi:hypothetical protein
MPESLATKLASKLKKEEKITYFTKVIRRKVPHNYISYECLTKSINVIGCINSKILEALFKLCSPLSSCLKMAQG